MKCSQANCDSDAFMSYVWPGRPDRSYACAIHYVSACSISQAMGFMLGDIQPCGGDPDDVADALAVVEEDTKT